MRGILNYNKAGSSTLPSGFMLQSDKIRSYKLRFRMEGEIHEGVLSGGVLEIREKI